MPTGTSPTTRMRCGRSLPPDFCSWLGYSPPSLPASCLDEIAEKFAVGRRTAERMRDAVAEVFPQLEEIEGERPKRWRLPNGLSGVFREPLADELAALHGVARRLEREGVKESATLLESLAHKIEASLKPARRRTLAPDVEALLEAEGFVSRPGPRPVIAPQIFAQIREALLTGRRLTFLYRSEGAEAPAYREVVPYGLLYGHRVYLVAAFPWADEPVNYRLDRMSEVRVSDAIGTRPRDFNLDAYAARSFGVFQEEPYDVVLRFVPEVADEVAAFQFHPTQTLTREPTALRSFAFAPVACARWRGICLRGAKL